LEETEARLRYLGENFPDWRIRAGYSGEHPDAIYLEGRRLERAREEIVLQLNKRGSLKTRTEDSEARTTDRAAGSFTHSEDYRSVTLQGKPYTLTTSQAAIVQMLHEELQHGTPELGQAYILERLGTPNSRLRDTFKGPELWGKLIVRGKKRGTYRLNLAEPTA